MGKILKAARLAVLSLAAAPCAAFATDVTVEGVAPSTGTLSANGNNWTATGLVHLAPSGNDSLNRSEAGWYAGIRRTWGLSYTGSGLSKKYTGTTASSVEASFSDNAGRSIDEYSVFNSLNLLDPDRSPDGGGVKNDFQTGGLTRYMKTTDWNVWVTPEMMNSLRKAKGEDYVATLVLDGTAYTITVPQTVVLKDADGKKWYPAVAEVDGKVYGEMDLAVEAGVAAAASGKDMEFYVEPTGCPANTVAVKDGSVWKIALATAVPMADAAIELSATEVVERDAPIAIEILRVTLDGLELAAGKDYEVSAESVLSASKRGEYTVKITGAGNYSGEAEAKWKIIEPTGEFAEDALSPAPGSEACGAVAAGDPRRFDITDTTSLAYVSDADGERWEARVRIRWPHEVAERDTYILQQVATKVQYTDAKHAAVATGEEDVAYGDEILEGAWKWFSAETGKASYYVVKSVIQAEKHEYEYFDTLEWTVPVYAADVAAAIESGAEHLEFSVTCSSVAWGDGTEGDVTGIRDTKFTVSLGLAKVFLLDDKGRQVFPAHEHDWRFTFSEDGAGLTGECLAEGCYLRETVGKISLSLVSKDARDPAYAGGHYRDGKASEAFLDGAAEFAKAGGTAGEVAYFAKDGTRLDSAPVEIGEYSARCTVAFPSNGGEGGSTAELKIEGLRILAGEAVMGGVHVPDAATYFEKATGDAMDISAGRSYTAAKTYNIPAKYGSLDLLNCGEKRYDLAGFEIEAPVDGPLFENGGRLTIRDSSERGTGSVSANKRSGSDVIVVNKGTLTIEGGTFYGSIVNDGGTVSISGGRFSAKPDASFVAEGFDLVRRGKMWCVEKHEHKYIVLPLGDGLAVATCANILADGTLQISHCSGRMLVGVVGIRMLGLVPQLSVDYDRKEHPAEFYAVNLTAVADLLKADGLLDAVKAVIESDPANLDAAGVLALLDRLSENADFAAIIGKIGNVFVSKSEFEKMTGAKIGEISYTRDGEPAEGLPVEAGRYVAAVEIETADCRKFTLKGAYRINEKELPIETEGHDLHIWTFAADGAKVTATCPGNILLNIRCNASPMGIELVPSAEGGRKVYDAQPLGVAISNLSTFVVNTGAKVSEVAYVAADGTESAEAPVEPGEYTAKATVSGTLSKHVATLRIVIKEKAPERDFPVRGWTKHVGSGDAALVAGDGTFHYPVELRWPYMIEQLVLSPRFTAPARARISISTAEGEFTGEELLEGAGEPFGLAAEAGEFFLLKKFGNRTYMKSVAWNVPFTFEEIDAARAAGKTEIVRTITLEGKCGEDDMAGLKPATYTVILDIADFVVNDAEGRQIYPVHRHEWQAENTGAALTLTCAAEDCPQAPGLAAELSVGFEKKRYDGIPAKAAISGVDAMRIHANVVFGEIAYVELGEEGAEYPLGATAPSAPGRYRAAAEYSDGAGIAGSLAAEFEIQPIDAAGMTVYFGDPRMMFFYSGTPQGPDIASVWYGPVPLRYGIDFEIEGDARATEAGEYSFAVVGKGKFEGRKEFTWRIAEPVRPFAPDALKIPGAPFAPRWGEIGEDGRSAVVVASSNLFYDARTERWVAPLAIDWPHANIDGVAATPPHYTDPAHAHVEADRGDVYLATSFFKRPCSPCPEEYVVKVLWTPSFTLEEAKAALEAGKEELVFEISVGSPAWAFDPFGLKTTVYRLVVPVKGLVLDDGDGTTVIDWYWIEYRGNGADSGEMAIERRLAGEQSRLAACAYAKEGFNLLGWSRNAAAEGLDGLDFADRQIVSGEFETGVTNTIYAVWTTDIVLSGDICGEDGAAPVSVSVWGVGSTAEDAAPGRAFGGVAPWRYVATVPARGSYNIAVVADDGKGGTTTTTALATGAPDPADGRKSEAAVEDGQGVSSVVDNSRAGSYPAVAGGLDGIARKIGGGKDSQVEVRFIVTEMPADAGTPGYSRIRAEVPSGCAKPLDFTLAKYVDDTFAGKLHDLTEFGGLVRAVLPFKTGGRRNLKVVRYHEDVEGDGSTGSVYVLPEGVANANASGECFEQDEETGELQIRGAKLSTYAILWDGAEVSSKSLVWHVDWLSGMYVPEIELEVGEGMGWASTVGGMAFLLEKREGVRLWNAKTNKAVEDTVVVDGVEFYKVALKDRFAENGVDGADSAVWGAAWYDANWINAAMSEILLYAPAYWPANPADVPAINDLVAYVAYESCGCECYAKTGANKKLMAALSAVAGPPVRRQQPAPVAKLNASLAVGAAVGPGSEPYCRLVDFAAGNGTVSGAVEVGAGRSKGAIGGNAAVAILGAESLSGGFERIATVECDAEGRFSVSVPEKYRFFKVELSYSGSAK